MLTAGIDVAPHATNKRAPSPHPDIGTTTVARSQSDAPHTVQLSRRPLCADPSLLLLRGPLRRPPRDLPLVQDLGAHRWDGTVSPALGSTCLRTLACAPALSAILATRNKPNAPWTGSQPKRTPSALIAARRSLYVIEASHGKNPANITNPRVCVAFFMNLSTKEM